MENETEHQESNYTDPKQEGGHSEPKSGGRPGWVWIAIIIIVVAGILYFTRQSSHEEQKENVIEENQIAEEEPTIEIIDVPLTLTTPETPEKVPEGALFSVDWAIEADEPTGINLTAIYWDTESHADLSTENLDPNDAGYTNMTEAYKDTVSAVPATFEDNIKIDDGKAGTMIYLRAYANILDKHYWSNEISVPIVTLDELQK